MCKPRGCQDAEAKLGEALLTVQRCLPVTAGSCLLYTHPVSIGKMDHARMGIGGVLISLSVAVEPVGG